MTASILHGFPFLAVVLLATPSAGQDAERARSLFVANCATCHGETGDGKGTTQLDRPARSFMDGGFSFGNTPEALFRTITVGIPGTPMPGFDASLGDEERRLLADYVVTLGPPIEPVADEDMVLEVRDRPLVVRGLLPAIAEGLPTHPRGLLIGDPSGVTFEYRVDDVRLLGLRQGGFVRRTDWTGRGGTPLEPLGKVVTLVGGGKPPPVFSLGAGAYPLAARLSGTRVDGERVFIGYHLMAGGRELAHVEESPLVETLASGTGYARLFQITGGPRRSHLAFPDPTQVAAREETFAEHLVAVDDDNVLACLARRKDGAEFDALHLEAARWSRRSGSLIVQLEPGERATLRWTVYPVSAWDEAMENLLEAYDNGSVRVSDR